MREQKVLVRMKVRKNPSPSVKKMDLEGLVDWLSKCCDGDLRMTTLREVLYNYNELLRKTYFGFAPVYGGSKKGESGVYYWVEKEKGADGKMWFSIAKRLDAYRIDCDKLDKKMGWWSAFIIDDWQYPHRRRLYLDERVDEEVWDRLFNLIKEEKTVWSLEVVELDTDVRVLILKRDPWGHTDQLAPIPLILGRVST